MASGNPPNPGPICCVIAAAAACGAGARGRRRRVGVLEGRAGGVPRHPRAACSWHKQANVLAALPKSAHPGALAALKEIYNAEDIDKARVAIKAFEIDYGAKYPKAVAKIVADADVLLEFYRYPAEHWIHLRTTNPIESTFATVRLRTKVTKGPGSRAAGLAMAYKLIEAAQTRWRAVNAPRLVALVRNGAVFRKGKLLNGPSNNTSRTRRITRNGGRLKHPHPQVLTISPSTAGCYRKGLQYGLLRCRGSGCSSVRKLFEA